MDPIFINIVQKTVAEKVGEISKGKLQRQRSSEALTLRYLTAEGKRKRKNQGVRRTKTDKRKTNIKRSCEK